MNRGRRVAFVLLHGFDHFVPDLLAALPQGDLEARAFYVTGPDDLAAALAWADDPVQDALWFEFCRPPLTDLIAATEFEGRRVIVRIHRMEAYGTDYAARAPWAKITDVVVVAEDMAQRLRRVVPNLAETTRLHVIHNGLDLARYALAESPNPFRIGWCGYMSLHKNPNLALQVLHRLRADDSRYELHIATKGGELIAWDSFLYLARQMGVAEAIFVQEDLTQEQMPHWHACNGVLLSTSVYESFGYAIAEAAAVGCDLAVMDNMAAGEFWPEAVRFATVDEAVALIRRARPHRWRVYVARRFSLARQVEAVRALLAQRMRSDTPVARRLAHGGWLGRFSVRNEADHIQRGVAGSGRFYEAEMLQDLRARLTPGAVFVDVGANVGNHSLFAAAVCGARVVAFEPSPTLWDHCEANLKMNGVADQVLLRQQGVGARDGRARLIPGPAGNAGMTRLEPSDEGGDVEVVSLDESLAALGYVPSVMKIDVEGMELDVLHGAERTLRRCRPALYVEAADASAFEAVSAFLQRLGYEAAARFNATPTYLFINREPASPADKGEPAAA